MSQCSICLSSCKEPVCIPCGHVYCKLCLKDHANTPGSQALTSKCPDCRETFHLTVPNLAFLPQKYHPFVTETVRRVYIDAANSEVENTLKAVEARLARKAEEEEQLMQRCEGLTAALDAHRQGEREANERIMELEEEIAETQNLMKKKDEKISELERRNMVIKEKARSPQFDNTVPLQEIQIYSKNEVAQKLPEIHTPPNQESHISTSLVNYDCPNPKDAPVVASSAVPDNTLPPRPNCPSVTESLSLPPVSPLTRTTPASASKRVLKSLPRKRVLRRFDNEDLSLNRSQSGDIAISIGTIR